MFQMCSGIQFLSSRKKQEKLIQKFATRGPLIDPHHRLKANLSTDILDQLSENAPVYLSVTFAMLLASGCERRASVVR